MTGGSLPYSPPSLIQVRPAPASAISSQSSSDRRGDRPKRQPSGFDRFSLRHELTQALDEMGFTEPRPIQVKGLPPGLEGRDVLGLAQTGTGKTAAFVLPILQRLLVDRRPGLRVLVVAPTRELASQVHEEFERLAQFTPLKSAVIFGGVPATKQIRALRAKPDIVVACPGRLLDLANQRQIRLDGIEVLVLDEADHMFDMGFLPDVRRILKLLPARRQNLLFSATMAREIRKLADDILQKPAVIELANAKPAETIDHYLVPLSEADKPGVLQELVDSEEFRSAIVFTRTKHRAKRLAKKLEALGHAAIALQGNMSQAQRERALKGYKDGTYHIMVATDIAARGLDIAGVSHVINYDVPMTPDAYTHRIGRTGRSERSGLAYTLVTADDSKQIKDIERRLGKPIEKIRMDGVELPDVGHEMARGRGQGQGGGRGGGSRRGGGGSARGSARGSGRRGSGRRGGGGRPMAARPGSSSDAAPEPRKPAAPQRPFGLGLDSSGRSGRPDSSGSDSSGRGATGPGAPSARRRRRSRRRR